DFLHRPRPVQHPHPLAILEPRGSSTLVPSPTRPERARHRRNSLRRNFRIENAARRSANKKWQRQWGVHHPSVANPKPLCPKNACAITLQNFPFWVKIRKVITTKARQTMPKPTLRVVLPTAKIRKVTPRRPKNGEIRTREYLTEREVEQL